MSFGAIQHANRVIKENRALLKRDKKNMVDRYHAINKGYDKIDESHIPDEQKQIVLDRIKAANKIKRRNGLIFQWVVISIVTGVLAWVFWIM